MYIVEKPFTLTFTNKDGQKRERHFEKYQVISGADIYPFHEHVLHIEAVKPVPKTKPEVPMGGQPYRV